MKRNDFATFLVYIAMIAIALLVGLLAIKPVIDSYGGSMPFNPVLIMVLGLVIGVLLNATMLEVCHTIGAKVGKYRVLKITVLGLSLQKKQGKRALRFSSFEGLTGETKVAPIDVKKSSLSAYIFFPVLFLFIEFIVCMIVIVTCQGQEASNPSIAWLHVFLATILTVGGMVFLYDLFPARIDSMTDGYLLVLLTKPANKEAYNNLLMAEEAAYNGDEIPEMPIYSEVTDFTASLNMISAYRFLGEGKPEQALPILESILADEAQVSAETNYYAASLKLATLLERPNREKGKQMYQELSDAHKKYIAAISSLPALRCYLLISAFIEDSESEANYAIDKAERSIKAADPNYKETEKSLLQLDVDLTRESHLAWDVYKLPWEEQTKE